MRDEVGVVTARLIIVDSEWGVAECHDAVHSLLYTAGERLSVRAIKNGILQYEKRLIKRQY